jgi:superfamily I DNA/RNA helicase
MKEQIYDYFRPKGAPLVVAAEDPDEEDSVQFQELNVADYIVFLFSLDTYMRYLTERGKDPMTDKVCKKGLTLLRVAERDHLAAVGNLIKSNLVTPASVKLLEAALRPPPNATGAGQRALRLRTVLSRGGTTTTRAVFGTSTRARMEVQKALAAAMLDDEDAGLNVLAALVLRDKRLEKWIDLASEAAVPGTAILNPVQEASGSTSEVVKEIITERMEQEATSPSSVKSEDSTQRQLTLLDRIQADAEEKSRKALERSGQQDVPMKRSEVIGLAVATAVSVASDPEQEKNVPEQLRKLDPEQRAAALTSGRVLVAAGAGAGKSTTLVSRIGYLVKDQGGNPSRILACSFNKKAAVELTEKISKRLGTPPGVKCPVQVGTMHSLFRKYVLGDGRGMPGYGSAQQKSMLTPPNLISADFGNSEPGKKPVNPASVSGAIRRMWADCDAETLAARVGGGTPVEWMEEPPKSVKANLYVTKWRGNNVSLEDAKKSIQSQIEAQACLWYEMYLGLKGDIPNWQPPCPSKSFANFMGKHRSANQRLGDMTDMILIFRDILRAKPEVRKQIQSELDHILVDECQDLNASQHEIFEMLSEHVTDGSNGKSVWMVGDDRQCIYAFTGAKPELFRGLHGKEGWKTCFIRTNYRCEPEIVDASNRLIAHNEDRIPVEAVPNPKKDRGRGSIIVEVPETATDAAIDTIGEVRRAMNEDDAQPEHYAVLARTNAELNDFETACIINEIPYVRQGGSGFLDSPESKAVLGYLDLITGADYKKMRESLIAILQKPDRMLFLGKDALEKAVDEAIDTIARQQGVSRDAVNPAMLLESPFSAVLARALKMPNYFAITKKFQGDKRKSDWFFNKTVEEVEYNLRGTAYYLTQVSKFIRGESVEEAPDAAPLAEGQERKAESLIDFVLDNMKSHVMAWDPAQGKTVERVRTLREQIIEDLASSGGGAGNNDEAEDDDEEVARPPVYDDNGLVLPPESTVKEEGTGLGSVKFLYQLINPTPNDVANGTDPSTVSGFAAKIQRFQKLSSTLKIDPRKWEKEQSKIADPGMRKTVPPAITLSTVHKVKGAEWENVTVLMPAGKFPLERKRRPEDPPPDPVAEKAALESERNLAYVALTRAAKNLKISCPKAPSPFVHEAGLSLGENVIKPGEVAPEQAREVAEALDAEMAQEEAVDEMVSKYATAYAQEFPEEKVAEEAKPASAVSLEDYSYDWRR